MRNEPADAGRAMNGDCGSERAPAISHPYGRAFRFLCHGAAISIETDSDAVAAAIMGMLPPGSTAIGHRGVDCRLQVRSVKCSPGGALRFDVIEDGIALVEQASAARALRVLEPRVHYAVARNATSHLFIHAGVVGWNGRAILIPGISRSGKSTLVHALCDAGATYYTDEYALIDDAGMVHAYRKRLRLRNGSTYAGAAQFLASASAFPDTGRRAALSRATTVAMITSPRAGASRALRVRGPDAGEPCDPAPPLVPGLILFNRFREGAELRLRRLSPGSALLRLVYPTAVAARYPARMLAAFSKLVTLAPAFVMDRGEACVAATRIVEMLNSWPPVTALEAAAWSDPFHHDEDES